MLEAIVQIVGQRWLLLATLLLGLHWARNHFNRGLHKYPGPFLASLTDCWRFWDVWGRRPDITQASLHKKNGDIVRLGPNMLSFANPKALKDIYGLNKGFTKSEFYPVQSSVSKGVRLPSLFSTTDEQYHATLRRSVNSYFSMTALVQYEPFVDDTTEVFLDQTDSLYSSKNATCDFARWLQFYAFDVIGAITYSKRHGFVDRGEDVDGIVSYIGKIFSYAGPIGQLPFLDLLLLKNPLLRFLDKCGVMSFTFPIVTFAKARMSERLAEMEASDKETTNPSVARGDLLSMFLQAKNDRPDFFHDGRVLTMAVSMAFAGSETTGISLAAIFYFLLRNPRCYQRLMDEIDAAVQNQMIQDRATCLVSWAESQKLTYLDACVKEAFRLHPAVGLPLERVVPAQGATICGELIPGGTIVGCNAWVIHHREEIFGCDVEEFRPERWLETSKEVRKEMEACMFHFGMGPRTCIGKNISLLEIYKVVPSFLRRFEIEFANPDQDWKLHNAWFVKQLNFNVKFKPRRR